MTTSSLSARLFTAWLRRRRLAVLAVAVVTAVLGTFAARVHPDYSIEHFFPSWSAAREVYDRFKSDFPHDDTVAMVVVTGPDIYTPKGIARIRQLEADLENLPNVTDVDGPCSTSDITGDEAGIEVVDLFPEDLDPADIPARKKIATTDPMFQWNLAAPDGSAVTIRVILDPAASATHGGRREFTLAAKRAIAPYSTDGWNVIVTGSPAQRAQTARMVQVDLNTLLPLVFAIVLAILYAAYRSIGAAAAGFATIAVSLVWSVGFMGILGYPFTMLSSILPVVVTIISLSDTVHIVNDWHGQRRDGASPRDALVHAMAQSAGPCLATEIVLACGFLSLIGVNIVGVIQFGIAASIAMIATWLANMTVLPLALSLVKGPPPRQPGQPRSTGLVAAFGRFVEWIGRQTGRRPRTIMAIAGILLAVGAFSATRVERLAYVFDDLHPDSSLMKDLRHAEKVHGGLVKVAIYIEPADLATAPENFILEPEVVRSLDRAAVMLESFPEIEQANSIADQLRKGYRLFAGGEVDEPDGLPATRALIAQLLIFIDQDDMLRDLLSYERTTAATVAYVRDVGSRRYDEMFRDIDAWVAAEQARLDRAGGPKVVVSVTGPLHIFHDVTESLVSGVLLSFGTAVIATLIVFCLVLRSVSLGLIGIIPNIAPMLLTVAFMAITGITLRPTTVIMFSIILVIADDDTMQYLARLRHHYALAREANPDAGVNLHREAALGAMRESGLPMFVTSTAVSMGFLLLMLSELRGTAELGLLIGVTLFTAIFADMFLAPILVTWVKPRL